ncbi:MAG: DUF3098 domain-containing protein [Bacteroidota bacterium]
MAQRKKKKSPAAKARRQPNRRRSVRMPFEKRNYTLLLGALGLIAAGYVLMMIDNGRGVGDDGMYLAVDSALSLTVAPLLLLGGYLGMIYAILAGFRDTDEPSTDTPAPEPAEA